MCDDDEDGPVVVVLLVVVSWEVADVSQLLLSHTPMRVRQGLYVR